MPAIFVQGQQQNKEFLRNEIGLGGGYYSSGYKSVIVSYARIRKKENEIKLTAYNIISMHSNEHAFNLGIGYCFSTIKRKSIFDFYIMGDLNYYYRYRKDTYTGHINKAWGPFITLGFSPAINFSNRFSFSAEIKVGPGYYWSNYWEGEGVWWLYLNGVKLNYRF